MELWDAYDKDEHKLEGVTLIRGEDIPEGMFHYVCEIIVRHTDGDYLLMQRDWKKPYGGMWEATAGGSALQGETPLEGAVRELYEETGLQARQLRELGRIVWEKDHCIFAEYFCETDCLKDSIVLQEGETIAYRWVSREALRRMDRTELVTERVMRFIDELHD